MVEDPMIVFETVSLGAVKLILLCWWTTLNTNQYLHTFIPIGFWVQVDRLILPGERTSPPMRDQLKLNCPRFAQKFKNSQSNHRFGRI